MLHHLEVIRNHLPDRVVALGQLLAVPQVRLAARERAVLALEEAPLERVPGPAPDVAAEGRGELRGVGFLELRQRDGFHGVVDADGGVGGGVVVLVERARELRVGGREGHEGCASGVVGEAEVGEGYVGGCCAGQAQDDAEDAL